MYIPIPTTYAAMKKRTVFRLSSIHVTLSGFSIAFGKCCKISGRPPETAGAIINATHIAGITPNAYIK
jgi:hypothetical protein